MRVLLFFLSRGSLLCAFVLFLLLSDVELALVLAEKKPVVPAETIAKWHQHHKLFKEKRLVRREGEAQSVSAEEKEEKSGWEDRWEHRVKVVEKNNDDDVKNNDAIAGKATTPNVAETAKEEESDLALKLFRKIPQKKREEILRALENFKKEKEAEEKEEALLGAVDPRKTSWKECRDALEVFERSGNATFYEPVSYTHLTLPTILRV